MKVFYEYVDSFSTFRYQLGYVGETVSVFGFEITIYGIFIAVGMLARAFFYHPAGKETEPGSESLSGMALIPGVVFGAVSARSMLYSSALEHFC